MTALPMNGDEVAAAIRADVKARAAAFAGETGHRPTAAVVRVGDDPGAAYYSRTLARTFERAGLDFQPHAPAGDAAESALCALIARLSADPAVHGILVLEPLPDEIRAEALKYVLAPEKDVDGVHPLNTGRLAQAAPVGRPAGVRPYLAPATPAGGLALLHHYGVPLAGQRAVVVGRSTIVGKPMALMLLRENATVTLCHSRTTDLAGVCRTADVLCVAVGRAAMVRGDWIKPGAAVIDFGVNFVDGEMVGDVAYDEVAAIAGMVTPVPGGTGPVTNAMLMRNVVEAAERQIG
jgi:methylenetetrahydrofolate dehydrogenase (NADP+)/methenyltetrahydrofolate cyclohydrolase